MALWNIDQFGCSSATMIGSTHTFKYSLNVYSCPSRYQHFSPFAQIIAGPSSLWRLPLIHHSCLPSARSTAGPSSLCISPLIYHAFPCLLIAAGPSSLCSSPLIYHNLVPSLNSTAGPSSRCSSLPKYHFVQLSVFLTLTFDLSFFI